MTTKDSQKDKVRALLGKIPAAEAGRRPPVIQEVAKPKEKTGRKKHRPEGVKYARLSGGIPEELKIQMEVAIKTTLRDTYPTMEAFIEAAVRELLRKHAILK